MRSDWFGCTYVADDSYFGDAVQDIEPDSNVLGAVSDRPSHFTHELIRVNADLKDVVGECKERRQRKGSHEDCDETELENFWSKKKGELTNIHFHSRENDCLSSYLYVYLPVYLSSICMHICSSVCLLICLPICRSVCLLIRYSYDCLIVFLSI